MKKYIYFLATMFIGATAFTGCSSDDNTAVPTPTPTPVEETDVVDLGLPSGTLWATANLGATNSYETGNLYAWGETYVKSSYSASNYFDPSSSIVKTNITGTDYDAAKIGLGGEWVMPTAAQFEELFSECKVSRTKIEVDEKEVKVLKLVGPNEKVIYLPEATGSVTNSGTLYDSYLDEKGKEYFAKFENVFAAYWTGDIAASAELNANQYAKQAVYVEHAKDAVKKGGADQYGEVTYNRSRLMGAPIRPVKTNGGTPVSEYVDIRGIWAECDATGNLLPLSEKPSYMTFEGTNYNGKGVSVTYSESYAEYTYSRDINDVTVTIGELSNVMNVSEVTNVNVDKRVISMTANGETKYFIEYEEPEDYALEGKWDFTYEGASYVINLLKGTTSCKLKNSEGAKETVEYDYRFGTISINSSIFTGTFAVQQIVGGDCPFEFVDSDGTVVTMETHPIVYATLCAWNGMSDLPEWIKLAEEESKDNPTFIEGNKKNASGETYAKMIAFGKTASNTDAAEWKTKASKIVIDGGFKAGDRLSFIGYGNDAKKETSIKVLANGELVGTAAPIFAKKDATQLETPSSLVLGSDAEFVYIGRSGGTSTRVCEIIIERDEDEIEE